LAAPGNQVPAFLTQQMLFRPCLQLRFDCDSIAVRLPRDCSTTALRPFDDYVTTASLPESGLLHCGLK